MYFFKNHLYQFIYLKKRKQKKNVKKAKKKKKEKKQAVYVTKVCTKEVWWD